MHILKLFSIYCYPTLLIANWHCSRWLCAIRQKSLTEAILTHIVLVLTNSKRCCHWGHQYLASILSTWMNFKVSMDDVPNKLRNWITYPFQNINGCTVEVWEWMTNILSHFVIDVITYPWWYWIRNMLVKWDPECNTAGYFTLKW